MDRRDDVQPRVAGSDLFEQPIDASHCCWAWGEPEIEPRGSRPAPWSNAGVTGSLCIRHSP